MLIDNPRLLDAAKVYAKTGFWTEAAKVLPEYSKDAVRNALWKKASIDATFHAIILAGRKVAKRDNRRWGKTEVHQRGDYIPLKRHREIHEMRAAVPSPVTLGQKLMGEPLPGRSALNKVETDGRGNIAKRKPLRVGAGAISVPDIRINNNGHHA